MWLSGELDSCAAGELETLLSEAIAAQPTRLTVHLSELQFSLRAALIVIDAEEKFAAASKELRVAPASRAAERALALGRQLRSPVSIPA